MGFLRRSRAMFTLVLLTACTQPFETAFIHDICLSADVVSLLLQRKQGVLTRRLGPHPSYKTAWHKFSVYRLTYALNSGEAGAIKARAELLGVQAATDEPAVRPTFANQSLSCEFSEREHHMNVQRMIYFSDKNYDITGFSGKKTTVWAFEDDLGQCFLKKTRSLSGELVVSCPASGLMAEYSIGGDHSFYIDSAQRQIVIVEADDAAGHLMPDTDKRLSIWRYRRGESVRYHLTGVKHF